jgi:anti-sigma factor RsiW
MNDCPNADVRDLLPELVNDRLGASARADVEAHLATCADCRAEVEVLRGMRATFGQVPSIDVARIAAAIPPYRAPVRRVWVGWRAAAAITVLVAGGSSVVLLNRTPAAPEPVVVLAPVPRVAPAVADSIPVVASPTTSVPSAVDSSAPAATSVPRPDAVSIAGGRELAMAGSLVDLSDRELDALLRDIESLDALPTTEVDAAIISPMSPSARGRGTP